MVARASTARTPGTEQPPQQARSIEQLPGTRLLAGWPYPTCSASSISSLHLSGTDDHLLTIGPSAIRGRNERRTLHTPFLGNVHFFQAWKVSVSTSIRHGTIAPSSDAQR